MEWSKKPIPIENWDESIDVIIAIDENGSTDLDFVRKNIFEFLMDPKHLERIFTITGVIMERSDYSDFKSKIVSIKEKHWNDGLYLYGNRLKRVVLHSREIRKKEQAFNPKLINYDELMLDISDLVENSTFRIISSSIDKFKHIQRYSTPFHVYKLCLEFLIERYAHYLNTRNMRGVVMLESRGPKEDNFQLKSIVSLLSTGNAFFGKSHFQNIQGVYFNDKRSRSSDDRQSYVLIELADLVSYPIFQYVRDGKESIPYNILKTKIYNYPNIYGYGLKIFP